MSDREPTTPSEPGRSLLRRVTRGLAQAWRAAAAYDRRTAFEQRQLEWARAAIDESARLTKATLEYSLAVNATLRGLAVEAVETALRPRPEPPAR